MQTVEVEEQDIVTLSFTGKLDSGDVFKVVPADAPLQVTIGDSELPPTVEIAIIGMKIGERKKIRVPPDEGYGPRLKELLHEVPRQTFGDRFEPKAGMILSQKTIKEGREHRIPATVIEVKEHSVVIDYNHPLAGHHLTYDLTILDIRKTA